MTELSSHILLKDANDNESSIAEELFVSDEILDEKFGFLKNSAFNTILKSYWQSKQIGPIIEYMILWYQLYFKSNF